MATPSITPDQSLGGASQPLETPQLGGGAPPVISNQPSPAGPQYGPPVAPSRGLAAKIIGTLADVLGGKSHNEYSVNPDTGKTETAHVQNTRGQQVGHILQNALGGLAAGSQVHGPNAGAGSIGAGASAVMQQQHQQDQGQRQQAAQDFEQGQQAQLRQAQVAHLTQETAASAFNMKSQGFTMAKEAADSYNNMQSLISSDPNNKDFGEFKDMDDLSKNGPAKIPDLFKLQAQGLLRTTANPDGSIHVFEVNPSWSEQKNADEVQIPIVNGVKPNGDPDVKMVTVPKGGMKNGDILNAQSATGLKMADIQGKKFQQTEEDKRAKPAAAKDYAEANKANAEAKAAQSGPGSPAATEGKMLVEGDMDPTQLSKRSKDYDAKIAAANDYSMKTTGKPFNMAQAQSDYKFSTTPQTQNTLKLIKGLTEPGGAIEIAEKAAKGLPGLDSQTANKVFNSAHSEFGDKNITNFHTSMLGLADEYSKVMGGGVSSDTGRQQALDILKSSYSKGQLAGAIDIMKQDIGARAKAIVGDNRYLQKQYGQPPSTPPPGASAEVYAADGKTLIGHAVNGQFVPVGK